MEKRNDVITVRISSETKDRLTLIAREKDWTLSHLCHKILTEYVKEPKKE